MTDGEVVMISVKEEERRINNGFNFSAPRALVSFIKERN